MTDAQISLMQLKNYQAMPLFDAKCNRTLKLVREWREAFDGMVYIALSGGKDSCVMADLIWSEYPDIPAVFCDTGNELDSVVELIHEMIEDGRPIEIIKPEISFWEVVEKYGWPILSKNICMGINRFINTKSFLQKKLRAFGGINPTSGKKQQRTIPLKYHFVLRLVLAKKLRVTSKCCGELKIKPFVKYEKRTGRRPFVGIMAEDSKNRRDSFVKRGCNAFKGNKGESRPIIFWTEQDILHYAREKFVKMASAYGEMRNGVLYMQEQLPDGTWKMCGDDRTGCKFCMLGIDMKKGKNRIQRLGEREPHSYIDFIAHGGGVVMDLIKVEWRLK